jgi:hypothetical protein
MSVCGGFGELHSKTDYRLVENNNDIMMKLFYGLLLCR